MPEIKLQMRSSRLSGLITKTRIKTMPDIYEDLGQLMGDLEFGESLLETMILNGKNEKANRYLREAALEIRHALSDLSDALFELTTSPEDIDDDNDLG